jgi:uncharacterized repeat protein (TIGR01451 family)
METTHYPLRAGYLAIAITFCLVCITTIAFSQLPTITVRLANPDYNCITGAYCLDVEFKSDQEDIQLFGMNVRFFYDDNILELIGFSDFQGGYGPVTPDPPIINTNGPAGPTLFNFAGPAEFVNGAIQLVDPMNPVVLDTSIWTKIFQICFTIDDTSANVNAFCPSIVWDLEQNPANGGYLIGDDGVVITIVDPDPFIESGPSTENVVQFNWEYSGPGTPPYGAPIESVCISLDCSPMITCAADITIECDESTDPTVTGAATATDICEGDPVFSFDDVIVAGSCLNNYSITRTWIVTNACNLSDTCVQSIMVIDTTAPSITCPANITVTCATDVPPANINAVTATDNCGGMVTVTYLGDQITQMVCENNLTISRTYRATDVCGNSATCAQTITVSDQVPPVITCPPDITIGLTESTDPLNTGTATATDNCAGSPTLTYNDVTLAGPCIGVYIIHRTWIATDLCANTATCDQFIEVGGDCVVDLALVKTLDAGQGDLDPGDAVDFTITISNEGNYAVGEIHVIDYIPLGFALNDPDWTAGMLGSTGQSASITLSIGNGALQAGGLLPGQSVSVSITLLSDINIVPGVYENIAEITNVFDVNGNNVNGEDVDSTPDTVDTNDPDAEDDHDPELICILNEPVILGPVFACPGDTITYTVGNYNPNHSYVFMLVNGGGIIISSTPSSVTIQWGQQPGGPFEIRLTEIADQGCQESSSIFVYVEGGGPVACIDHINLSIDNDCGTQVFSGMILTGDQAGNNTYQVYIIDMNGDTVPNATLTWEHVGQTFKVSVVSICTGQSCWGFLTVEDKLPPIIDCVCPLGNENEICNITCLQVDQFLNGDIPEELRPNVIDSCGNTTLEIININLDYATCVNGYGLITWLATDNSGNTSTCVQEFGIIPLTVGMISLPWDYFGDCEDSTDPSVTGWPTIDGYDLTDETPACNLYVSYKDVVIKLCGNGRKIIRTWRILDWCAGDIEEYFQSIWLRDITGPELTCNPAIQAGTNVWGCYADVTMPKPQAIDACSGINSYKLTSSAGTVYVQGNTYSIRQLPVGTHTAVWTVTDACYNTSTCSIQITVVDNVPPAVSCHSHTIVGLTSDRPNGVTLVPAESFNDGSHDNCGPVTFRARRMDSCIDFDWTTGGACVDDIPGGNPSVNGYDRGTSLGACVPFACCDIGSDPIMVELEVTDAVGNKNYCMVEVEVQDKLSPQLTCPPEIRVSCEYLFDVQEGTFHDATGNNDGTLDEDPLSEVFGNIYDAFRHSIDARGPISINDPNNPVFSQPHNWGLEGWAVDNCSLELTVVVKVFEDCSGVSLPGHPPAGAVKLIERRFIGYDGTQSGSCLQRIWVIDYDRFYISDSTCLNADPLDGVIWPCDVLISTCSDDLGDTGEPLIIEDGCSLIGVTYEDHRFDFADGACYKILREWKVLDWCQFNQYTGDGLWKYTQTIKVADSDGAVFLNAPSGPVAYCLADPGISLPDNNQIFLGENDPQSSSCSVHVSLSLQVQELCSESVLYDVKIYPFNGNDFIQVVPATEVALDFNHQAELGFNTEDSPIPSVSLNGLPYNDSACGDYHRIVWSVEDGCGNKSYADYLIRLEDCKDPTPVCIDGISTVVMPEEGEVTIWASDFNASSFDDCTPGDELLFSFSGDTYQPSYTYTCDNIPGFGVEIPVEIWAADGGSDLNCNGQVEWGERNADFCITYIIITDNNNICGNAGGMLAGQIMTELTDAVSLVTVTLNNPENNHTEVVTAQDGKFVFNAVPFGSEYTIHPERNDDHRNGVSTLDLVRIQKHLLGQQIFTSPYQYIAADANSSQSVSAIDLVEIRKLILGIQDKFSVNQSWRFVPTGIQMSPGNPWPFDETIEIDHLDTEMASGLDFVGVKIGDVNNTVKANAMQVIPRNGNRVIHIRASGKAKLEVGEEIEVLLEFPEVVSGFQWTLEAPGLEFAGISSEAIHISNQNVGVFENGTITMSWNGDLLESSSHGQVMSVKLTFKVIQPGRLLNILDLNSKITAAEAYTSSEEVLDLQLIFNSLAVIPDFALYQNKPNPWNSQTLIGFHLPADAKATLNVYDIDGKVVKSITGNYKAGYNSVILRSDEIPTSGILYYRLESGEYSASKKMVIIQ